MTEFKVGDKVRRIGSYQVGSWPEYCDKYNCKEDDVFEITKIFSDNITLNMNGHIEDNWDAYKFELVSSPELNNIGGNMTTKVVYNVLSVNKKTGRVDKDETVVAEDERQAILKAYGVDVDNLTFSVTSRTTFEEQKPQTVIVENAKK
ncbi:MAG: hypothetical protein AABY22_20255 [Nanoarchaeota archaeon]